MTNTSPFETILVETDDESGVTTITFNRPSVRNALSREMAEEIRSVLGTLKEDPSCRSLIFTGSGDRAFMSGADIAELKARNHLHAFMRINTTLFHEIETFPRPTIAAIRGYALGGGCELAMACDLRVATTTATLGQPEVSLGIIPAAGGCYRLPKLVGLGRAKELIYTGRLVPAPEAAQIGLVEFVVPEDELMTKARELAESIASNSALAVHMAKVLLNGQNEMSTAVALALESTSQAVLYDDPEKHERMGAFLDKRAARRRAKEKGESR
jgi:enoyl-CoA hydratase